MMALVATNVGGNGWDGRADLDEALVRLPPGARVTVMVHGFRYSPFTAAHNPHDLIFARDPQRNGWKSVSWSRHLHLHRCVTHLGLAFAWNARGSLPVVAQRAYARGMDLAQVIGRVRQIRPDCNVSIIAHSLGARVALAALAALPARAVHRIILMSGADYLANAATAMASPAGQDAEVLNVVSRENALFDGIFRLAAPPALRGDAPLSSGLPATRGWTDLPIDCAATRFGLRRMGYRLAPPVTSICHWSTYIRPGLFPLYRNALADTCPQAITQLGHQLRLHVAHRATSLENPRVPPRQWMGLSGEGQRRFPPCEAPNRT